MNELLTVLDTKYKRLEYIGIRTSGSQTSGGYIDTLYTPTLNTKVRVVFSPVAINTTGYFGARNDPYRFGCITFSSATQFTFALTNNTWSNNKTNLILNQTYDCIAENGKQTINGTEYSETIVESWGNCGNFYLGRVRDSVSGISYSNANYCLCQIWENRVLVRNMIPVLRKSDNEIGMLDLVEGKFYTNAGTGKFTANLDTMYALIQGTPTVQDGRVSGFSASNYLKLDRPFVLNNDTVAEFCFRINATSLQQGTGFFGTFGLYGLALSFSPNNIHLNIGDGNSWNLLYASGITTLSTNTDYFFKLIFNKGNVKVLLSTDNTNWTEEINSTISLSQEYSYTLFYGIGRQSATYFRGSIDLNRSYIKIDGTKYKLQAVVGYTVVGSPTIVDGVVSGFSSANYVQVGNFTNTFNSIEMITKAKRSETGSQPILVLQNGSVVQSKFNFYITNNGITFSYRSALTNENKTISMTYNFEIDTYYYFKIKISNSKIILGYSANGTNWIEDEVADTMSIASNQPLRYGVHTNYPRALAGAIDMNETYIKKDNKLWFNGLEA